MLTGLNDFVTVGAVVGVGVSTTLAWSSSPALLLFGVESTSGSLAAATCAVLVYAPVGCTVALMASVAELPTGSMPTSQLPLTLVYEPCEASAETNAVPLGRISLTVTPVAVTGPALASVTVNTTVVPTVAVRLLAALVSDRSIRLFGEALTLAWSSSPLLPLPGLESGSVSTTAATCAVLVYTPLALTRAEMASVAELP